MFQVLFGLVLICFIAFAVYHYRQKLPVVQSALSNYHPGWSPKVLSRATLRNTFQLIVTLVTLIVTIFPYWLSPILTTHSQYHVLQYYFHDELKSGLHFWHRPAPWFTKVMWSLSIVLAWDSDRWLTSNFLHTTLQRRSNTDDSYTDEGNLIPDES